MYALLGQSFASRADKTNDDRHLPDGIALAFAVCMMLACTASQLPQALARPNSRLSAPPHLYYNSREAGAQPRVFFVCRSPQMSIGKKKSEILRLIKRLESDGPVAYAGGFSEHAPAPESREAPLAYRRHARSKRAVEKRDETPASRRRREHLKSQEEKLDEIRRRRDELSATLSNRAVEDGLRQLEERVDLIESQLRQGSSLQTPAPQAPALQVVPLQPATPQAPALQAPALQTPALQTPALQTPAPAHIIGGMLKDGFMSDLLQLISTNEWNGTLVVGEPADEIRLEFCEGNIWNASAPGANGEGAVFALMTRYAGPYYFVESDGPPEERSIEGNTQFLILEGLRRIDEGGANTQES